MDEKKLAKIRAQIQAFRARGGIKPAELEAVARALGRVPHSRGKEPTWVSNIIEGARPISIPHHRELNKYTAKNILEQLESDVDILEVISDPERKNER